MGAGHRDPQKLSSFPPDNMKITTGIGLFFLITLLISLIVPEVESRSITPHRGPLARRKLGAGKRGVRAKIAKKKSGRKGRYSKKGGRRGGRTEDIPDADVIEDDYPAADAGLGAAGGEGGDICEVLMFDRGDGTYSLKFIQNKC